MKRPTLSAALAIAAISLWGPSAWGDDAHHPAPGAAAQIQTAPQAAAPAAASQATIKALQEALGRQGITVNVDGVLSDETRAAIRKYQAEHHLPVSGEPDQATLAKLGVAPSAISTTAQATPPAAQAQPGQSPQAQPQTGQGVTMMSCPMMQGQMQAMMQMMQGMMQMMQMMHGQMQPGTPGAPGQTQGMGPGMMMPGMGSGQMGPAQMQRGRMQPGQMQPGQTQSGPAQPGAK